MTEFTSRFRFPSPIETSPVKKTWEFIKTFATAADEVNEGHHDFLQPGVVESTDWQFTSEVNGAGEVQSAANTGGKAWVPDPVLGTKVLMRTEVALGSGVVHGLKPGTLPATGKYLTVGVELTGTTWNAAPTVSVVSGAEKTTEAEAIAAPPAVTAGKIRVKNVTIKNTAGVYSQMHEEDVRTYVVTGSWTMLTPLNAKLEEAGAPYVSPRARIEAEGTVCRLRGAVRAKSGETLAADTAIFTLPTTMRPPAACLVTGASTNATTVYEIQTTGEVVCIAAIEHTRPFAFDGITFNLT
jgi:hypothetical protein